MLVTLVAAVTVVPALAQGEQGCRGLEKAYEQQFTNGPAGINPQIFDRVAGTGKCNKT
jgi:hypothetical protein